MLGIFQADFMIKICLFVVLYYTATVWAGHSFNTERNILVWLLSRWPLQASSTTTRGIVFYSTCVIHGAIIGNSHPIY